MRSSSLPFPRGQGFVDINIIKSVSFFLYQKESLKIEFSGSNFSLKLSQSIILFRKKLQKLVTLQSGYLCDHSFISFSDAGIFFNLRTLFLIYHLWNLEAKSNTKPDLIIKTSLPCPKIWKRPACEEYVHRENRCPLLRPLQSSYHSRHSNPSSLLTTSAADQREWTPGCPHRFLGPLKYITCLKLSSLITPTITLWLPEIKKYIGAVFDRIHPSSYLQLLGVTLLKYNSNNSFV